MLFYVWKKRILLFNGVLKWKIMEEKQMKESIWLQKYEKIFRNKNNVIKIKNITLQVDKIIHDLTFVSTTSCE